MNSINVGAYNDLEVGASQKQITNIDVSPFSITLSIPSFTVSSSQEIKKFSYISKRLRRLNKLSNVIALDLFSKKTVFLID